MLIIWDLKNMNNDPRSQSDEAFLADCRVETYRGPGPGGQKRNKTSSAVRITHLPTSLQATATELRSQPMNRSMALRRLRLRVAIEVRQPVDVASIEMPAWFTLDVSDRNELYPQVVGLVLDVLAANDWATAPTKDVLKVGSSQLTKFLHGDPSVWAAVNRERGLRNLRPLTAN